MANHQPIISFKPVEPSDLPLLYQWFQEPHVKEWWPVPAQEEFFSKFLTRIRSESTRPFLVYADKTPCAYIQYYKIKDEPKIRQACLPPLPDNTIGTDQFIGDPAFLKKGYGTRMLTAFITFLRREEPTVTTVIVDPESHNITAIKCYEKVGFKSMGIFSFGNRDDKGAIVESQHVIMRYDI